MARSVKSQGRQTKENLIFCWTEDDDDDDDGDDDGGDDDDDDA